MGQTVGHGAKNDTLIAKPDSDNVCDTKTEYDTDTDSKLKHAVGKAIANSDTMGADLEVVVECYPESVTSSQIRAMLIERGESLGIKERYGKWYV